MPRYAYFDESAARETTFAYIIREERNAMYDTKHVAFLDCFLEGGLRPDENKMHLAA